MVQVYKPNSKNLGCAFSFRMGVKGKTQEPCLYLNGILQHSWDEKNKTGSFSENAKLPEKTIIVKLSEFEIGAIINAIENYTSFNAFHTSADNKTTIVLKPYDKKDGSRAFSLTVTRNSAAKFGVGIEMSEAFAIREYCKFILHKLYEFRTAAQQKYND
jgi:hypothetical protein